LVILAVKRRTARVKKSLTGQTALVTGGAVRIGRAIARALADQGCGVVVHYRRSRAEAAALCRELEACGVPAWRVRADLVSETGCRRAIDEAVARAGRLDILVNNAAVFNACPLERIDARTLDTEFRANLYAPIFLTRYFVAVARSGRIINLLDRRIAAHDPGRIPYALSKKALADFTRAAALALAPRFTVNGVAPGPVLPPPGESKSYLNVRAGRIPTGRPATPEEVADAVVFLSRSPSITGQIVFVDGGQHLLGEGV
jgi:NAD(P)-dependent dehydrogenase (short-subunit alcohol dehydrogenase family)